jgi:lipopolysaccharide transport protein LptA
LKREISRLALVLALLAGPARADLLDDDESTKTKTETDTQTETSTSPSPPSKEKKNTEKNGVEKNSVEKNSVEKNSAPAQKKQPTSTQVIPPKHPERAAPQDNLPVYFQSTGAQGLRTKGLFVLEKDVVVTRGDKDKEVMRLEADRAEVYFDEGEKSNKKDRGLVKVIADGKPVKINGIDVNSGDRFKAFSDRATFFNKERKVVLDGHARIVRGSDSELTGDKIEYEMATGWIRISNSRGTMSAEKDKAP